MVRRVVPLGVLVVVLLTSAGAAAALTGQAGSPAVSTALSAQLVTADAPASVDDAGPATTDSQIVVTEEYRLTPAEPGMVDVHWQFDVPDNVAEIETRLPAAATDVSATGFTQTATSDGFSGGGGPVYEWVDAGRNGSLTFSMPSNVTTDARTADTTGGNYQFVDTGDWALVRRPPSPSLWYTYRLQDGEDKPTVTYQNHTAGPGVVGDGMVYLGDYESSQWRAHDQTFQLVVPAAATLVEPPSAIATSLRNASATLRVGERDDRVLAIAAPTSVSWRVLGLQRGDSDFYVLANQTLDDPENVWLHEYVHTRQDGNWSAETRWFIEASAEYYAGLLTLEQDRIDYDDFRDYLARGAWESFDRVRLADPETWLGNNGDYYKGALAAGALDRRIRLASDGEATLQRVFRQINGHQAHLAQATFLDYVDRAGGGRAVEAARNYTETTTALSVWSRADHRQAFEDTAAVFQYDIPETATDGLGVRGPYRNGSLANPVLLEGETLLLETTVRNVGGASGTYNLTVTLDGDVTATRSGRLAAGAQTTETVAVTPNGTGSYGLGVGDEQTTIRVREPAAPRVVSVRANRSTPRPGQPVDISATVRNTAQLPAVGSVPLTRNGTVIAVRDVELAPGGETSVGATTMFTEPGTYRLAVGGLHVTVTVSESASSDTGTTDGTPNTDPSPSRETTPTAGIVGPGFGISPALVALLAVLAVGVVSRR